MEDLNYNSGQCTLSEGERSYWRKRLHSLRYDCGCKTGMVALLLSLVTSIYYFFYSSGTMYSSSKKTLFIFLICFGSTGFGKIIGISWSRMKYYKLRKKLFRKGIHGLAPAVSIL
jgi:hypothetical protein